MCLLVSSAYNYGAVSHGNERLRRLSMKQFMVNIESLCQPCEEQTTPDQKAQHPIAQKPEEPEEEPDEEPKQKKINLRKFAK